MWQAEIRVDLDAIRTNVAHLREGTKAEVMTVVKGDRYGHGLVPSARAALSRGGHLAGRLHVEISHLGIGEKADGAQVDPGTGTSSRQRYWTAASMVPSSDRDHQVEVLERSRIDFECFGGYLINGHLDPHARPPAATFRPTSRASLRST